MGYRHELRQPLIILYSVNNGNLAKVFHKSFSRPLCNSNLNHFPRRSFVYMRHLFYRKSMDQKVPIVNERSEFLGNLLVRIEPVAGDESSECDKHFLPNVAWITEKTEVCSNVFSYDFFYLFL